MKEVGAYLQFITLVLYTGKVNIRSFYLERNQRLFDRFVTRILFSVHQALEALTIGRRKLKLVNGMSTVLHTLFYTCYRAV